MSRYPDRPIDIATILQYDPYMVQNSGMFGYVDLSKYVPSYMNKKFLSYYSFLSLFRDKQFWQQIESLAKTEDLRMTLRGFDVIRGHGLLGLVLLSEYILEKYRTAPIIQFPEERSRFIGPLAPRFLEFYFSPACPFRVSNRALIEGSIHVSCWWYGSRGSYRS